MPRYQKGSVGNNWQRDEDGPIATAPRDVKPDSDAELMRKFANVRNALRAHRSVEGVQRLNDLADQLAARGITEVPESCAGARPTLAETLAKVRAARAA